MPRKKSWNVLRARSREDLVHEAGDLDRPDALRALREVQEIEKAGGIADIQYSYRDGWRIKKLEGYGQQS